MIPTDGRLCILGALLVLIIALAWWWARRGQQMSSGPHAYGLDFSWGRPSVSSILSGGYTFVCRYHSWDESSGKNLTAAEADQYLSAGIAVVSNWEYDTGAPKEGYWRGYADACEALWQRDECGGGATDPIYFSVDFDMQDHEYPAVADYFRGVNDVMGYGLANPAALTGVYGGYRSVRRLMDDRLVTYGWQTFAWSYGNWDPRAHLRQVEVNTTVGGAAVDINEAWAINYGAWGQSGPPTPRGDGTVILTCPDDADRLDLLYVGPNGEVWHRWYHEGGMASLWTGDGSAENIGGSIVPGTLSACWLPDASGINVVGLGAPDTEDTPVGCGSYWGYTLYRSGAKTGWGSLEGVHGMYPSTRPPPVGRRAPHRARPSDRVALLVAIAASLLLLGLVAMAVSAVTHYPPLPTP